MSNGLFDAMLEIFGGRKEPEAPAPEKKRRQPKKTKRIKKKK